MQLSRIHILVLIILNIIMCFIFNSCNKQSVVIKLQPPGVSIMVWSDEFNRDGAQMV